MASCEKCWKDAGNDYAKYIKLVGERNCTPEEQAGDGAKTCPKCGCKAMHIYCNICMNCGHKEADNG